MKCPIGYRLLKNGDIITQDCLFISNTSGKWETIQQNGLSHRIGNTYGYGLVPFCAPHEIKTPKGNVLPL